jgi:hypothetical protein
MAMADRGLGGTALLEKAGRYRYRRRQRISATLSSNNFVVRSVTVEQEVCKCIAAGRARRLLL